MGYISKGDRVTMAEQDLIDIIGVLGSPLQVLRVTADGLSLEYAAAGAGDVSKVGTPANNQVGVWTGDGTIEGDAALTFDTTTDTLTSAIFNSTSLTASEIVATDGSNNLVSLAVATYPSLTELSYVKGVTSGIQAQINSKGSGTVTAVSIATANGVSGSSSGGATPALTITLGAITPSTVNALTLASQAVGFTIAGGTTSKTLTVPLDASVSGTNTGDQDLSGLVTKATYDAHTVLYATTDDTPVALTVGEQTLVGRVTGGNISAIAIDSDLSAVSANHDTVPSAKATKAYADLMLPLTGGTMSGNITLGENASIALDPAGSADGKYTGLTVTGTAGYAQAFGDLVYLDPTDSRWEKTDANAASAADGDSRGLLGMVVVAGAADGNACTILLKGIIRADAAFPTFTINNPIYVSETAGAVTQTQPTTTDAVIRLVGAALTADEMYFNPEWDWIAHT